MTLDEILERASELAYSDIAQDAKNKLIVLLEERCGDVSEFMDWLGVKTQITGLKLSAPFSGEDNEQHGGRIETVDFVFSLEIIDGEPKFPWTEDIELFDRIQKTLKIIRSSHPNADISIPIEQLPVDLLSNCSVNENELLAL